MFDKDNYWILIQGFLLALLQETLNHFMYEQLEKEYLIRLNESAYGVMVLSLW